MRHIIGKKHADAITEEDLDDLESVLALCGHIHYPQMAKAYKETGYHRMIHKTYRHLTRRYGLLYLMQYMPYLRLFHMTPGHYNESFIRALWKDIRHLEQIRQFFPFDVIAPQLTYFCCLLITSDDERLYFDIHSSAYAKELTVIFDTVAADHCPWMRDVSLYQQGKIYYRASRQYPLTKIIQFYQWFTSLSPEEQNLYILQAKDYPLFQPIDIHQISEISECEIF